MNNSNQQGLRGTLVTDRAGQVSPPWWIRPDLMILAVVVPLVGIVLASGEAIIAQSQNLPFTGYSVTGEHVALILAGLLCMACFAWLGTRWRQPADSRVFVVSEAGLNALFVGTIAGYTVWFGPAFVTNPGVFFSVLAADPGASYRVRELSPTIAGVTTLTQFGVAYALLYCSALAHGYKYRQRHKVMLVVVLALAFARSIFFSERLAIVELVFTVIVAWGMKPARAWSIRGIVRSLFPLVIIIVGPLIFAVFEYLRSWSSHYQYSGQEFFSFAAKRLLLYYVTAFNNASVLLRTVDWPSYGGEWTMGWLYNFPVIGEILAPFVDSGSRAQFITILARSLSPEFNNSTGILVVYLDWGVVGGIVYFCIYGFVAGYSFGSYCRKLSVIGYMYPLILYSLLELPRITYVSDGRTVAVLIGVIAAYLFFRSTGRRVLTEGYVSGA